MNNVCANSGVHFVCSRPEMKYKCLQISQSVANERHSILAQLKNYTDSGNAGQLYHYVVVINGSAPNITIRWLIELLEKNLFKVQRIVTDDNDSDVSDAGDHIVLIVSATDRRLNIAADDIELKQLRLSEEGYGKCAARCFHLNELSAVDSPDAMTCSERQRVMLHEIEGLHATERGVLFGYPSVKLYPGQSILQVCQRENIVVEYFALHDSSVDELRSKWFYFVDRQPIHEIRNYFGEKIAFYFAFLEFYTRALLVPGLMGVIQATFLGEDSIAFALFYMVYVALFLKEWKRRSNELAYQWGTIGDVPLEGPRRTFRAKQMQLDPITRKLSPIYPIWKTWLREYGLSLPIVLLSLTAAFRIMCLYFSIEADIINYYGPEPTGINRIIVLMPGIVYAIVVMIMNHIYRKIATKLNEWENHRTQTSHENHWIIKLVLFEFVNNFMSLFYIGFYLKDLQMLKWQLGTMLIVNQIADQVQEVLIPLATTYRINQQFKRRTKKSDLSSEIQQIIYEKRLPHYEGTYYDYLELYVQFGYVFLFASIFPLGPIIAFINNMIELRSDAFKLCNGYKRPNQRFANAINGAWMKTFEVMGIISVITNCALMTMSSSVNTISDSVGCDAFHLMVAFEHIILGLILIISYVVPDMPRAVNITIMKQKYDNKRVKI